VYVAMSERSAGLDLLRRAQKADETNPLWRYRVLEQLRIALERRSLMTRFSGDSRKQLAKELLDVSEEVLRLTESSRDKSDQAERPDLLRVAGMSAVETGDLDKATRYAELLLKADDRIDRDVEVYPLSVHYGSIILGRVAARKGQFDQAKQLLRDAHSQSAID